MAEKIELNEEGEPIQTSNLSINLKGLAFARDCKYHSILKLNTIEDKLMSKYYKQIEILKTMRKNMTWRNNSDHLKYTCNGETLILAKRSQITFILQG